MVRRARVDDVHAIAGGLPHVTLEAGRGGKATYQVGGKSFVIFRTPRPDAVDPQSGLRYDDVIIIWVGSDEEKRALLAEKHSPLFTTPHFDGHPSVLLRGAHVGKLDVDELTELIQDAWLARASPARARAWLADHGLE